MNELFHQKVNHYNLQNMYEFSIPNANSVSHEQESISYLSPLTWQLTPPDFKDLNTASAFKTVITKRKLNNYSCRLRKMCTGNIGFKLLIQG